MLNSCLAYSSTLKMEAIRFFKTTRVTTQKISLFNLLVVRNIPMSFIPYVGMFFTFHICGVR
jgi:hypothetical protein